MIKTNVPNQPIGNIMDFYDIPSKGSDTDRLIKQSLRKQILKNIEKKRTNS